ncbi:MAG: hypothetical protein SFV19_07570 [Rhodospirillaceae bacterium]|nr:hypothetical protein [Rhodospirillaceae bacterium]
MVTARAAFVVILTVLALASSGCGKKAALTPPEGSTYPQTYPKQ